MRISSGVAALRPASLLVACAALLVGACSGAGTFPGPSWNLTGGKDATRPPQQPSTTYRGGRDPITGRSATWGGTPQGGPPPAIEVQPLPAAMPPPPSLRQSPSPAHVPAVRASQVEVRPGQSLAAIAAEQRVSIASLMAANKLRDPYVIPGQVLVIPRP